MAPKVQTTDSCYGLIGSRQCSVALGGPATSTGTKIGSKWAEDVLVLVMYTPQYKKEGQSDRLSRADATDLMFLGHS